MTASHAQLSHEEILKQFEQAHSVPLIDLAKQFVEAGMEDNQRDSKTADTTTTRSSPICGTNANQSRASFALHKLCQHLSKMDSDLRRRSQNLLFSRLRHKLICPLKFSDQQSFLPWINDIKARLLHSQLNDFEHIILGLAYQFSLGCELSIEKAIQHYEAAKSNPYAQVCLASVFIHAIPERQEEALPYLNTAIKAKNIGYAYYLKGWLYDNDNEESILKPNSTTAFNHYLSGAKTGCVYCTNCLAICYKEGDGTTKDLQQTINYYIQSISQGGFQALHNYAKIMLQSDIKQQLNYYLASAKTGLSNIILNAANLLANHNPNNAPDNITQAAALYRQAFVFGNANAKDALTQLHKQHLTNYAVCYYKAVVAKDIGVLKNLMQDAKSFIALWLNDFYSDFCKIKQYSIEIALTLLPPDENTQASTGLNRIRANLAIYFFEQQDIKKACCYLRQLDQEGLFPEKNQQKLSAHENYEMGFWIYTHAKTFTRQLATAITPFFERFEKILLAKKLRAKNHSCHEERKITEKDLLVEQQLLLMHAFNFIKAATLSDDKEIKIKAKTFLYKTSSKYLTPDLSLFNNARDEKREIPAIVSTAAHIRPIDDESTETVSTKLK
jgi:TPR repeat protein